MHTWLPDTTAAATPGTSVLLVCVLDKIGTYGMLRFCLGLFPEASKWATPLVITLAVISIMYGALVAVGQDDMLRLIGLTSLSHFGFIVLGIFVMNSQGISGATLFMVNHGVATAALFLVAGYLMRRRGSSLISDQGGVEKVAPMLAGLFLVGGLATLGLPGLSPFVSEFLVMVGAFTYSWWVGAIAVTGIVLAALYILIMYPRTFTGPMRPGLERLPDLDRREVVAVAPLVLACVVRLLPQPVLDVINPLTETTMTSVGVTDAPRPDVIRARRPTSDRVLQAHDRVRRDLADAADLRRRLRRRTRRGVRAPRPALRHPDRARPAGLLAAFVGVRRQRPRPDQGDGGAAHG